MNNGYWTSNDFLYKKLLNRRSEISSRNNTQIIDIYDHYRDKRIDIEQLCIMGADITNFTESLDLEGIKIEFQRYAIIWKFNNYKLFGIHLHSCLPRLMVCTFLPIEYFEEAHPDIKPPQYYKQHDAYVFWNNIKFQDVEGAFIETIQYIKKL